MITAGGIIDAVRKRLQGRTTTASVDLTSLIAGVRGALNDKVDPYRWDDAALLAYLNEGVMEVRKLRNDACLNSAGEIVPFTPYTTFEPESSPSVSPGVSPELSFSGSEASPSVVLPEKTGLNADFQGALQHYMLYRAFEIDSDDQQANNALAGQQYKLFGEQLALAPRFHADAQLYYYLVRGMADVACQRPDLLISDRQQRVALPSTVDAVTEIELPDSCTDALVFYVIYRAFDGTGQEKPAGGAFAQYMKAVMT
jgi:hypothetical protein